DLVRAGSIDPRAARLVAHQTHELIAAEIAILQPSLELRRGCEAHTLAEAARGLLHLFESRVYVLLPRGAPGEDADHRPVPQLLLEFGIEPQLIEYAVARRRRGGLEALRPSELALDRLPQYRVLEDVGGRFGCGGDTPRFADCPQHGDGIDALLIDLI